MNKSKQYKSRVQTGKLYAANLRGCCNCWFNNIIDYRSFNNIKDVGLYMNYLKNDKAFLSALGWIIGSLFVLVVMVAYASYILTPITNPIINATNGTANQAISQNAVSRGFTSIDLMGVAFPVFLVLGFFVFMILRDRQVQQ